jgi:hypothetical protein
MSAQNIEGIFRIFLTPMLMVTGAATMIWGIQRIQMVIYERLHLLANEQRALAGRDDAWARKRRGQIVEQLRLLTRRVAYARNAIVSFYASILAFFACSVSLVVVSVVENAPFWLVTATFQAGMAAIYCALLFTICDVTISYRSVKLDCE